MRHANNDTERHIDRMKRVHVDDDDFVWHVLTETEACYHLDCGLPVHIIDETGDRKANTKSQIQYAVRHHVIVATPVGYMDDRMN